MTRPIYAIGDIHGFCDSLFQALDWIASDGGRDARVVFTGDYVDRGPDSRAVIEALVQGVAEGRDWIVLRGNHDRMFCRFVRDGALYDSRVRSGIPWLHPSLGGSETLASYGVTVRDRDRADQTAEAARVAVPEAHLAFLAGRPLTHVEDGLLFVHAGIRPGVALGSQTEDDLIWIREPFLSHPNPHPWLIVHGHTALERPQHFGNRIDIDGGAGFGRTLCPVVIEAGQAWSLGPAGRTRLNPPTA
jgi:serine/threonine protein phosphatase 1